MHFSRPVLGEGFPLTADYRAPPKAASFVFLQSMLCVVVFAAPRSLALELDLLIVLVVPFLGRKVVKTFLELEIFTWANQIYLYKKAGITKSASIFCTCSVTHLQIISIPGLMHVVIVPSQITTISSREIADVTTEISSSSLGKDTDHDGRLSFR